MTYLMLSTLWFISSHLDMVIVILLNHFLNTMCFGDYDGYVSSFQLYHLDFVMFLVAGRIYIVAHVKN